MSVKTKADSTTSTAKHKAEELKGRGKQAVGQATGNQQLHDEGVVDELKGDLKQAGDKIRDGLREGIDKVKDAAR